MGCFNQMPFLSHIPLTAGAPAALIFMLPEGDGHAVYHTDNYKPVFLPVFGDYDDYGKIENVERDFNVACIEKFFGKDIDTIIREVDDNLVGRDQDDDEGFAAASNFRVYEKLVFTLEHRAYWDALGASYEHTWYENGYATPYFLEDVLGLAEEEKKGEDKRFNRMYCIPGVNGYKIASDGTWSQIVDAKTWAQVHDLQKTFPGATDYGTYTPAQMARVLSAVTGEDYVAKVPEKMKVRSTYGTMYDISAAMEEDYVRENGPRAEKPVLTTAEDDAKLRQSAERMVDMMRDAEEDATLAGEKREESVQRYMELIGSMGDLDLLRFRSSYKGMNGLTKGSDALKPMFDAYTKINALYDPRLAEAVVNFLDCNMAMGHNSLTYQLSSYGSQDTHWDFHIKLAEIATGIAKDQKALYGADEDEE